MQDRIEELERALGIELPSALAESFSAALAPHLAEIERILSDCKALLEHYQHLVTSGQLHPESAVDLIPHVDLLRFHLVEPTSLLESLLVMAEYRALVESEHKTVELKRKQASAWVQRFEHLLRILKEYAAWMDRVAFTLRAVARRGDGQ